MFPVFVLKIPHFNPFQENIDFHYFCTQFDISKTARSRCNTDADCTQNATLQILRMQMIRLHFSYEGLYWQHVCVRGKQRWPPWVREGVMTMGEPSILSFVLISQTIDCAQVLRRYLSSFYLKYTLPVPNCIACFCYRNNVKSFFNKPPDLNLIRKIPTYWKYHFTHVAIAIV